MAFGALQELNAIVGELELYEFTFVDHVEYYTTGRTDVTLPAGHALNPDASPHTYVAIPIARDVVKASHKLRGKETQLVLPAQATNFQGILIDGGLGPVTVGIIRGFGDPVASPDDFLRYWFVGVLEELKIGHGVVAATVKSIEHLFDLVQAPRIILSRSCNHKLYQNFTVADPRDASFTTVLGCQADEPSHTFTLRVTEIAENGTRLKVEPQGPDTLATTGLDLPDFTPSPADTESEPFTGYFTLGKVYKDGDPNKVSTMVLAHEWTPGDAFAYLYTHSPVPGLSATPPDEQLVAIHGCDKKIKTCIDKFNQRKNAMVMPNTPVVNPVFTKQFNP